MLAILMKICYIHLRSDYICHTDRSRLHVTNYSTGMATIGTFTGDRKL